MVPTHEILLGKNKKYRIALLIFVPRISIYLLMKDDNEYLLKYNIKSKNSKAASSVCVASEWHSRGWAGLAAWQEEEGFRRRVCKMLHLGVICDYSDKCLCPQNYHP